MKKRQEKLVVKFSHEQTEKYFDIVSKKFQAEVDEEYVSSGAQIVIDILGPFWGHATVNGVSLGEINMEFVSV